MADTDGLVLAMPSTGGGTIHWCRIADGAVLDAGESSDLADMRMPDEAPERVMLVLHPADTQVHFLDAEDLPEKQAIGVARVHAAEKAIGGDANNHIAAAKHGEKIITATVNADLLGRLIGQLEEYELSPDIVMPAGLVLPEPADGEDVFVRGQIGGDAVLRSRDMVVPDEAGLRAHLIGDASVIELESQDMASALVLAYAAPPINLRSGAFAKKRQVQGLSGEQWRKLAMITACLLVISIAIVGVQIAKYSWGADLAEAEVLREAQDRFPAATDLATAERLASEELARRGLGDRIYSVPTSALFAAMQPMSNVTIRNYSFQPGGIISVDITGARVEDINQVLIALQDQGYMVTVPPNIAQDETGSVTANITVRGS